MRFLIIRLPFDVLMLSDRLTTSAADVEFLLNLSLRSGRRLFQQDVSERKVVFVFVCRSKADDELSVFGFVSWVALTMIRLIEVEEGGKFQVVDLLQRYGN